jgi:tetratricopeptide (TPR) repeat protein
VVLARQVEVCLFDSDSKLRHLPFFEAVARSDEGSANWRVATAGLVVLRLVDAWLENASTTADDDWGIRSVRTAVNEVDEGTPIRAILGRILDGLEEQKPDIHVVVAPLMAYARALEYEAEWPMAIDVYHSVLAHLHPFEDADASIAAHMRLGYCYRALQLLDDASEAFAAASEIATEKGDMVNVLLALVNEGHNDVLRGNLPRAEAILDDAILRATGSAFEDVRARALHERSNVAHHRGDYERAIQLAYAAYRHSQTPTERDRILNDMAVAFSELGVYSAARDAYLVLSATAQEQYMRWAATINLMELSYQTGGEMLFELYRRQLSGVEMPPLLATSYQLFVGLGYRRFGDLSKARSFLERALTLAEQHALNQQLFDAEEALLQLDAPQPPLRTSRDVSLDLEEVACAIRELRESVGAA